MAWGISGTMLFDPFGQRLLPVVDVKPLLHYPAQPVLLPGDHRDQQRLLSEFDANSKERGRSSKSVGDLFPKSQAQYTFVLIVIICTN